MNRVQAPPSMIAVGSALMVRSGNAPPSIREPFRFGQRLVARPGYRPGTMAPRVPEHRAGPDRSLGVDRIPTRTYQMVRAGFDRGGAAGTRGARTIMDRGMARMPIRSSPAANVIAMSEAVTGVRGLGYSTVIPTTYRDQQAAAVAKIPLRTASRSGSSPYFWGGVTKEKIPGSTITPGLTPKTSQVVQPAGAVLPLPGSPGYAGTTSIVTPTPSPMSSSPQSGSTDLQPFVTRIDPAPTTIAPTPVSPVAANPGSATSTVPLDQIGARGSSIYQGGAIGKAGSSDLVDGFGSPSWTPPPPPAAPEPAAAPSGGKAVAIAAAVIGALWLGSKLLKAGRR